MVSSVLAQAITGQRPIDFVGQFEQGRADKRAAQSRELSSELLQGQFAEGSKIGQLAKVDPAAVPQLANALNIPINDRARLEAFAKDTQIAFGRASAGDVRGAVEFVRNRRDARRAQGVDTSNMDDFLARAEQNPDSVLSNLKALNAGFEQAGVIKPLAGDKIRSSQFIPGVGFASVTEGGKLIETPLSPKIKKERAAAKRKELDDKLTLLGAKAEASSMDLSAALEKRQIQAVDDIRISETNAAEFLALADQFEAEQPTGGVGGKAIEALKTFSGQENAVSLLRRKYTGLRNSTAIQNLPPGVASDKDIQLALAGFPEGTANPDILAQFLRGMAKMEQAKAAFEDFRAAFISGGLDSDRAKRDFEFNGFQIQRGDRLTDSFKAFSQSQPAPQAAAPAAPVQPEASQDLTGLSDTELQALLQGATQ